MKKRIKLFGTLLASVLLLTGCGTNELKTVYKAMQIKEGNINGYSVNVRLSGLYKDEKISQSYNIQNYMNTSIKVVDQNGTKTYIQKDGKNYVAETKSSSSSKGGLSIGGNGRIEMNEEDLFDMIETEREEPKYEETTEEIPFIDTDIFLTSLKKAKDIEDPEEEVIASIKFTKYTYKIGKNIMKEILAGTALKDIELENDVYVSVWVDENGYVYKIVYDIASGVGSKFDLELSAYYSSINEQSEITVPGLA